MQPGLQVSGCCYNTYTLVRHGHSPVLCVMCYRPDNFWSGLRTGDYRVIEGVTPHCTAEAVWEETVALS